VAVADLTAALPTAWSATATGLAIFDLDRTMVRGSSLADVGRALVEAGVIDYRRLARHLVRNQVFTVRGAGPSTVDRLQQELLAGLEGWEQEPLVEIVRSVGPSVAGRAYPGARWLLEQHQRLGDRCVLLSASPQELVEAVASSLGFAEAVGTVAEVAEGRYTGRLSGPLCHGQGKLTRLHDALGPVDLSSASAYTDSASDVPLLQACGRPVAVNPDRRLRSVATRAGWPVVVLR
jgi:HAD superfamily hydrolase (TIGR01490 family)